MRLEDQVCSYNQAKKLYELGVFLKSAHYLGGETIFSKSVYNPNVYPAYTVAELGFLLRQFQKKDFYIEDEITSSEIAIVEYLNKDTPNIVSFSWHHGGSEAQARADALIWLIENEYVNPNELTL